MADAKPDPNESALEEVLVEEPAVFSPAPGLRRDPTAVVALLKTLAVVTGGLGLVVGVGGIVVVALKVEGWALWIGTLGGVVTVFVGAIAAAALLGLAHLIDGTYQTLARLNELGVPGRLGAWNDQHAREDQAVLLREIRDAVRLTEEQKAALVRQETEREVRSLVETIERHLTRRDFQAARAALAQLNERHGATPQAAEAARRVEQAELTTREAAVNELVENVQAYMSAQAWGQAAALADELVHTFPDDPRSNALRGEVRRRRDEATGAARQQLYDRITALAREHRWRDALDATSELIEQFPESPEAEKLRPRIGALSKKAENTERRRLLTLVREHTQAARWGEAYRAARDLVDAYPDSPEAAQVFGDLARLRRLAKRP
jgi:outer membrane protein assembly factor BamD (BamD/ComL family)